MMGSSEREGLDIVSFVKNEGFDFIHDERLNRRLKRRKIGIQCLKANRNGKLNPYEGIKALKSNPIQIDDDDSDVDDEDYKMFLDYLVRGLLGDNDAYLDVKPSLAKKNNGRNYSSKCIVSPDNAPKSCSCFPHDDGDIDEVDEYQKKNLKNLDKGLCVDSEYDAYVDVKYSLSKKKIGAESTDNGNIDADLASWFAENNIVVNGVVDDGRLDPSLDGGSLDPRSVGFGKDNLYTAPVSSTDNVFSVGTVDCGQDAARGEDNDLVDKGNPNDGVVGEEARGNDNNVDSGSVGDSVDNDVDPTYKQFLDNYGRDETSSFLKIPVTSKKSITIRYDHPKSKNTRTRKVLKGKLRREKMEAPRKLWAVPMREKVVPVVENEMRKKTVDSVSCRAAGLTGKRPCPEILSPSNCKLKCETKLDMMPMETRRIVRDVPARERRVSTVGSHLNEEIVDDNYLVFLNALRKDGERIVFTTHSGKEVLYEEDETSDSEVIILDTNPFSDEYDTPFVTSKAYIAEDEGWREIRVSSKFKEGLVKDLEKAYDEKEYEELWKLISHRGHKKRTIEMRSGSKSVETKAIGKSYLDHHADLQAKIQSAKDDRPAILKLLRGFFYWLKHSSHDGAGVFRPWLDLSCLKVQPHCNIGMSPIQFKKLSNEM